ncbi:helix-turn-helix domain-containing protein [Mycobacterium shigaense]|nr:helix-turn-helix domain-containing protein [Mycobacterium shigaense]
MPSRPTIAQVAEYLNVDPKTVRRYLSSGRLRGWRTGPRLIRIDRESVLRLGQPVGGVR